MVLLVAEDCGVGFSNAPRLLSLLLGKGREGGGPGGMASLVFGRHIRKKDEP